MVKITTPASLKFLIYQLLKKKKDTVFIYSDRVEAVSKTSTWLF